MFFQELLGRLRPLLFFSLLAFSSDFVAAQLSVRTITMMRHGHFPKRLNEPNIPSGYTDVALEYREGFLTSGVRLDAFGSPRLDTALPGMPQEHFFRLSQGFVEGDWDWGGLRVGDFYETFGKGLLLRGFELPGFIYEDVGARNQRRVFQDFFGQRLRLHRGPVEIILLNGKPNDPLELPDGQSVNRTFGRVTGGQASVFLPGGLNAGGAFLQHRESFPVAGSEEMRTEKNEYVMQFLAWSADQFLSKIGAGAFTLDLYAEYAHQLKSGGYFDLDADAPRAFYGSASFSVGTFGGSFEYKRYNQFEFAFNEPAAAIRENSEYLLDRTAHTLEAESERGYQLELYYAPFSAGRFTLNLTRAKNEFAFVDPIIFTQRFFSFEYTGDPMSVTAYVDRSAKPQFGILKGWTLGSLVSRQLQSGPTVAADVGWQRLNREFFGKIHNQYVSFKLQNWKSFNAAFSIERTEDPDLNLDFNVTEFSTYLPSFTLGWQATHHADFQLFVGKRRGGTFCDHGFCIEVLDFEGVELRVETRW